MSSQNDPSAGSIIKTDRSGRIRYTSQYKEEVLVAFESSSLSASAFARQCSIKYPTFAAWIAARKRGQSKRAGNIPPTFLVAEVAAQTCGTSLEVRLPGGAVARVTDAGQVGLLAVLLRQLA